MLIKNIMRIWSLYDNKFFMNLCKNYFYVSHGYFYRNYWVRVRKNKLIIKLKLYISNKIVI